MTARSFLFTSRVLLVFILILCLIVCAPRKVLAASWTDLSISGSPNYDHVASSNTGQYLIAADNTGDVYYSSDYGVTWSVTLTDAANSWTGVAISDNGQYLAASQNHGGVWVSADNGATWDETYTDTLLSWNGVAVTADGQHMVAVAATGGDGVFYSDTYGQINSWTQASGMAGEIWAGTSYAPDGSVLMIVSQNTPTINKSVDNAGSWTSVNSAGAGRMYGVALANDDIALIAGQSALALTTNRGLSWTSEGATTPSRWNTVAVSHDGQVILAGGVSGELSLSTDGGTTWEQQSAPGDDFWNSVAVSGDGTHLAAFGQNGAWKRNLSASDTATTVTHAGGGIMGLLGTHNQPSGPGSGYVAPRPQTIYPDGRVVYLDTTDGTENGPRVGGASGTSAPAVPSAPFVFTRSLRLGSSAEDVRRLQIYLNTHGFPVAASGPGSPGNESDTFGSLTRAALIRFQEAHASDILIPAGLSKGSGVMGPATIAYVNAHS